MAEQRLQTGGTYAAAQVPSAAQERAQGVSGGFQLWGRLEEEELPEPVLAHGHKSAESQEQLDEREEKEL